MVKPGLHHATARNAAQLCLADAGKGAGVAMESGAAVMETSVLRQHAGTGRVIRLC